MVETRKDKSYVEEKKERELKNASSTVVGSVAKFGAKAAPKPPATTTKSQPPQEKDGGSKAAAPPPARPKPKPVEGHLVKNLSYCFTKKSKNQKYQPLKKWDRNPNYTTPNSFF